MPGEVGSHATCFADDAHSGSELASGSRLAQGLFWVGSFVSSGKVPRHQVREVAGERPELGAH